MSVVRWLPLSFIAPASAVDEFVKTNKNDRFGGVPPLKTGFGDCKVGKCVGRRAVVDRSAKNPKSALSGFLRRRTQDVPPVQAFGPAFWWPEVES
jgi:hypothetical protein